MTKKLYTPPVIVTIENRLQFSLLEDSNTEALVGGDNPDNEW